MILSKRICHVMIDSDYKFKSKGDLKLSLVLDLPRDSQTTPSQTGTVPNLESGSMCNDSLVNLQ